MAEGYVAKRKTKYGIIRRKPCGQQHPGSSFSRQLASVSRALWSEDIVPREPKSAEDRRTRGLWLAAF